MADDPLVGEVERRMYAVFNKRIGCVLDVAILAQSRQEAVSVAVAMLREREERIAEMQEADNAHHQVAGRAHAALAKWEPEQYLDWRWRDLTDAAEHAAKRIAELEKALAEKRPDLLTELGCK